MKSWTLVSIAFASFLLSLACNGPSSTLTSLGGRPRISGKWHLKYHDKQGYPGLENVEFFEGGDFSFSNFVDRSYKKVQMGHDFGTINDMFRESGAGTYKFIDNSHIKMETAGMGGFSEVYELVSLSDKKLILKGPDSTEEWIAGYEAPPTTPGSLEKLPVEH
jgi:hypothetical protein